MADPQKQEKMAEAYRRGILPDDARLKYEEAMNRGLVPDIRKPETQAIGVIKDTFGIGKERQESPAVQRLRARYEKADRNYKGAFDTFTNLPFSNEYTGAVNAGYSAAYNLPGLLKSGDLDEFGGKVANAYDEQVKGRRQSIRDYKTEKPYTSSLITGTRLGLEGVGIAKQFPGVVAQGSNMLRNMVSGGANAATSSAAWSSIYGLGDNEGGSLDARVDRAKDYAKWGAIIGGPIGAAVPAIPSVVQSVRNARMNSASGQVLDMARQSGSEVSRSSLNALKGLLRRAGYARKDVDRGISEVMRGLNEGKDLISRPSILAVELQKRFPAASQNIEDAFQQLATAPPKQGNTSQVLLGAIDDQQASQTNFLDDVFQERLGITTIADEQAALAAERKAIGASRDKVMKFAPTDARITGETRSNINALLTDIAGDARARPRLQQAARELGHGGSAAESIQSAMANPADQMRLLQRFSQVSRESGDDVVRSYRAQADSLFDDVSRQGPRTEYGGFGKQVPKDSQGPYKAEQQRFAQNYSQEEAIANARNRFAAARDPVKADEFVSWYNTLPSGEQRLVQTVIRQDMEKMLRGGNVDNASAYLTNLRKQGIHDVLVRVLGKDGEDISRAIQSVADEQPMLAQIDPRAGMQNRVVRGGAAERARNLYTNNPIARMGDRIPTGGGFMMDAGLMASGQLPYFTLGRQASKAFRPGTRTREGLANILAMRALSNVQARAPSVTPSPTPTPAPQGPRPIAPPPEQKLLPAPASAAPAVSGSQTPPVTPQAAKPQPQRVAPSPTPKEPRPAVQEAMQKRRNDLLSADEQSLPASERAAIVERRENWHKSPQSRRELSARENPNIISVRERASEALSRVARRTASTAVRGARAAGEGIDGAYYRLTGDSRGLGDRVKDVAGVGAITSPLWGGGLLAKHWSDENARLYEEKKAAAAAEAERRSRLGLPQGRFASLKPDLTEVLNKVKLRQLQEQGLLISEDGTQYYDPDFRGWRPIEQLQRD